VSATDSSTGNGPYTVSQSYTLTVNAPSLVLSPTSLPAAQVGAHYSQGFSISGGTAPYSNFVVSNGSGSAPYDTLPAGLTLSSSGTLSGTPTAGGIFTFIVSATDSSTGTGPFTQGQGFGLTVIPVVTAGTTILTTTTTSLTIDGFGFASNTANDQIAFNGAVTGTISAATATTLTVTGLTGLNVGPLSATVTVNGAVSNQAQVATVSSAVVINDNTPGDTLTLMQTAGTGTIGDITYILGNQAPVILTGVTSFTYGGAGGHDTMIVEFPTSTAGVLVSGTVSFNSGLGAPSTLTIEANGLPVQSQSGAMVVGDPQTVTYTNVNSSNIIGAGSVNTICAPDTADRATAFTGLTAQERFVQALYLDELGRAGAKSELDAWVQVLNSNSANQVAFDIAHSEEAADHLVKTWYLTFLGRAAGNGEELGFVNALLAGASEESVLSGIVGGTEFFNRAQTLVAAGTRNSVSCSPFINYSWAEQAALPRLLTGWGRCHSRDLPA
jgi:hypothetical protein